jgi:prevent-host-death family protein
VKRIPARDAKNQLGEHIEAAQREAVIITKHGRPAAGLVSIDELAQIPRYRDVAKSRDEISDKTELQTRRERIMRWYGALKDTFGSAADIDARIARERASWDR